MKCTACGHENLIKADYCAQCGQKFTEEEKQKAYNATFFGKLDKAENAWKMLNLSAITSNPVFRVLVLAGIIFFGFFSGTNRGSHMELLENDQCTIAYNTKLDEYYLFTDRESVSLPLYLPGKPEGVRVETLDSEGNAVHTEEYEPDEIPVLSKETPHYRVSGIYENGGESMILRLYDADALQSIEKRS